MRKWVYIFNNFYFIACVSAAAISLLTLFGLIYDLPEWRQWFGIGAPMRMNTAIGLLSAALAMIALTVETPKFISYVLKPMGWTLALITMLISALTLLHYQLRIGSPLDQLLFNDPLAPYDFPGRPSPETALCLFLISSALFIMNLETPWARRLTRILAVVSLTLPLLTLIGLFFGPSSIHSLIQSRYPAVGTATSTGIAEILLATALFFRKPDQGIALLFISDTAGGMIARRQLIALLLLPFVLALTSHFVFFLLNDRKSIANALSVLLALGGLIALNWFTAYQLDRMERQQREDKRRLEESEKLLANVLETVPVGIWITDASGRIVKANRAGINIWRGEHRVGIEDYGRYKGWWANTGELIESRDWAMARALEKGETSLDETIQIECFDGTRKVILNSAIPLRNEKGAITGSLVTNYDISERYRFERNQVLVAHAGEELIAMRDLTATFSKVAKLTTESLCDCSLIHIVDENGTLQLVSRSSKDNPSAKRFDVLIDRYQPDAHTSLGIRSTMERGRSLLMSKVEESTIQSLAQDENHATELRETLQSYMLVPMIVERKVIGVISLICCQPAECFDKIDLTAAEEIARLSALAIENARYADKLRLAIQTREDMVAIVSHDLRSPLSVIMQSCDLLLSRLSPSPDRIALARKLTSLAKTAASRMHELISHLLDLAYLESGRFLLKTESLDGRKLSQEVIDLVKPIAIQKGIKLLLEIPDNLPFIHADRTRLMQVLNNLLGNAIKFTPPGGVVSLSVYLRDDGWLNVAVTDSGNGIKQEYLPHLFERYWKPENSHEGFGLGLFVVKGIVEAHGGQIHAASEEGKGTSLSFTLPSSLIKPASENSFVTETYQEN